MPTASSAVALEKFTTFGDLLRYLRRRAGLTQMELATAVGYSDGQISRLEQNQRLPDLPTIPARFASALDIEHEPATLTRLVELASAIRREDVPASGSAPFKGLRYFDENDAALFFGREALIAKLLARLTGELSGVPPARFLAVVAPPAAANLRWYAPG
jgi:transcriptional regulator with XRE-family HTH domain